MRKRIRLNVKVHGKRNATIRQAFNETLPGRNKALHRRPSRLNLLAGRLTHCAQCARKP